MYIKKIGSIRTYIVLIFVISVLVNFVWEMLQMPFYFNYHLTLTNSLVCLIASFGDAIMILFIFFIGIIIFKKSNWFSNVGFNKFLYLLIVGLILSVLVELAAIRLNLWSYNNIMPRIKLFNVGLTPVLQMLILPLFVFYLTKRIINYSIFSKTISKEDKL